MKKAFDSTAEEDFTKHMAFMFTNITSQKMLHTQYKDKKSTH